MRNKHEKLEVTVEPTSGILPIQNLKSLDNWRAFIHQVTPVVVTTLVAVGIVTNSQVLLWVPLLFAIIDPILSSLNATDKIRKIIYGVAGLCQSGGLIAGLATGLGSAGGQIAPIVGVGVTIISAFLGRFYTPTTTMVPKAIG